MPRPRRESGRRASLVWAVLVGTLLLYLYPALWEISRSARRVSRTVRGTRSPHEQAMKLPASSWLEWSSVRTVALVERSKRNGNVHKGELAVLSALAAPVPRGGRIFEIDGRTTANLAFAAPISATVFTLDLPATEPTLLPLARGEEHMVKKTEPGARYRSVRQRHRGVAAATITQLLGDSASFP